MTLLAENPTDRIDDIGLAAAVGTDDAGGANAAKGDDSPFAEGLKANDFDFSKLKQVVPFSRKLLLRDGQVVRPSQADKHKYTDAVSRAKRDDVSFLEGGSLGRHFPSVTDRK